MFAKQGMNERPTPVAQQPGLAVVMSGREVGFNFHAYIDEKGFLKVGRLANAVEGKRE